MTTKARKLTSTGLLGGVTLFLFCAATQADDFGDLEGYEVPPDWSTVPAEHDNASYLVFKYGKGNGRKRGILFMQAQGTYAGRAFVCLDAQWDNSEKKATCFKDHTYPIGELREIVSIGRLDKDFCERMRDEHNQGSDTPIKTQGDCPGGKKCSCYEIKYECRFGSGSDWGECPSSVGDGEAMSADAEPGNFAPPSRGAGSGKTY